MNQEQVDVQWSKSYRDRIHDVLCDMKLVRLLWNRLFSTRRLRKLDPLFKRTTYHGATVFSYLSRSHGMGQVSKRYVEYVCVSRIHPLDRLDTFRRCVPRAVSLETLPSVLAQDQERSLDRQCSRPVRCHDWIGLLLGSSRQTQVGITQGHDVDV